MGMEFYGITPELYRAIVQIVDERIKEIRITHDDFTALKKTVEESSSLVDKRLAEVATILADLAKAQKETREETARLDKALAELAKSHAEAREEAKRLDRALAELAEAQKRTEESLTEWRKETREETARLDKALTKLAEAQAELMAAQKSTQREVARLAETLGFSLEDIARVVLPGYLERHLGAKVEKLKRKHFNLGGNEYEIDLYGEGQRNGDKVIVIGEVKHRIYAREVRSFNKTLSRIVPLINKDRKVIKVMFGFLVHPSAEEIARKEDILLVASYER
ncbi:MAG: hypothetical protein ACPL5F_06820 [Moorellaceae bacterium]